jgi:NADH-quinone oxidoreductase subunit J
LDLIFLTIVKWLSIAAAVGVVNMHNPVHAILLLIAVFIGAGIILLVLQAEFLALLYIVVYVGAIAVLFLFVIMCLNVKITHITQAALNYMTSAVTVVTMFCLMLALALGDVFGKTSVSVFDITGTAYTNWIDTIDVFSNIEALGQTLFLFHTFSFILVGLILFVAMIGSIVLTLSHSKGVRRQVIWLQNQADFRFSVRNIK